MAATFAGADTVGTAVTSENAPATIVLLGHSPADLSGSIGINKLASGFERRCGLLARARAESLWSRVASQRLDAGAKSRFYLARPPAAAAPAAQSYSRTALTNAEMAGENVRPATETSETSRTTS